MSIALEVAARCPQTPVSRVSHEAIAEGVELHHWTMGMIVPQDTLSCESGSSCNESDFIAEGRYETRYLNRGALCESIMRCLLALKILRGMYGEEFDAFTMLGMSAEIDAQMDEVSVYKSARQTRSHGRSTLISRSGDHS